MTDTTPEGVRLAREAADPGPATLTPGPATPAPAELPRLALAPGVDKEVETWRNALAEIGKVKGAAAAFGVALPASLVSALAVLDDMRREARAARTSDEDLAAAVLDAPDLARGLSSAIKTRNAERDRAVVMHAVVTEAHKRAAAAALRVREEVADAILQSPALAAAFETIKATAPKVSATLSPMPDPDLTGGVDALIDSMTLRKAHGEFERAVIELNKLGFGGGLHIEGGVTIDGGRLRRNAALLYADVSAAPDFSEVAKAVRGVSSGAPLVSAWKSDGTKQLVGAPVSTPAALAHVEGVALSRASTVEEFEARLAGYGTSFSAVYDPKPPATDTGPVSFVASE